MWGVEARRVDLDARRLRCGSLEPMGQDSGRIARLERGELGPSLFVANRICGALSSELESLVAPAGLWTHRTGKRRTLAG